MSQNKRATVLPVAMIAGLIFSNWLAILSPATPYLIFVMLFITFCRISLSEIRFSPMLIWLLAIQIIGGTILYFALHAFGEVKAQGVMICVFAPNAVSSAVIGAMLGANIATMASFTLLSNLSVAIAAPLLFSFIGPHADAPFWESFTLIISRVAPLLVLPIAFSFALKAISPKAHNWVRERQVLSFYLWAISLMIVTGSTVEFVKIQDSSNYTTEVVIACGALAVCLVQFALGRWIGGKYGDKPAGGQSLGQKNTVLAIWMSQTYLDPLSSIGPASYVLWQNIVNSYQLWKRKEPKG